MSIHPAVLEAIKLTVKGYSKTKIKKTLREKGLR